MTVLTGCPPLKRIIVGIESTWKRAAVCGFSSMSSLTMRRSVRSAAISSRTGATTRQGPHHGAQKSTSTGPSASSPSASKLLSVICVRVPSIVDLLGRLPLLYKMKGGLSEGRGEGPGTPALMTRGRPDRGYRVLDGPARVRHRNWSPRRDDQRLAGFSVGGAGRQRAGH